MSTGTAGAWVDRSPREARFADLYRRHHRPIRDFCRRRVHLDLVDDAVAETFLTAWRRIEDVPPGDAALVWLYRVAYRVVGHQWRSTARRRRLEARLSSVVRRPAPAADEAALDADQEVRVLEAAARLSAADAEVLRLAAWEQLPIADIAGVLDLTPNAVKQRLHRARQKLGREYRRLEARRPSPPDPPHGGA